MQWPTFKTTFRKALENNTILGLIAIGLLAVNIVQAVSLARMRERVVLKPAQRTARAGGYRLGQRIAELSQLVCCLHCRHYVFRHAGDGGLYRPQHGTAV